MLLILQTGRLVLTMSCEGFGSVVRWTNQDQLSLVLLKIKHKLENIHVHAKSRVTKPLQSPADCGFCHCPFQRIWKMERKESREDIELVK